MIGRVKGYLTDVKKEMGKVTWLSQQEIRGSTIVVICFSFILAMIIMLIDLVILFVKQGNF
jgi:preprotein translocase SecE subunit|tara:strand:- start:3003 stop:3185 length:183 start_codon:yes stop_codon:yes gene_type:complete